MRRPSDRAYAEISLSALRSNVLYFKKACGKKVIFVCKASSYGHGDVAPALEECVDGFAVATAKEGLRLRRLGVQKPVLLLGYVGEEELPFVADERLTLSAYDLDTLFSLDERLRALGKTVDAHIKINTGMNRLGFEPEDRIENIRRVSEVAKLMNDAGLIVLTAFISPYGSDRKRARSIIGDENFVEVYVDTPLEVCEKRDVKGLYKRAREKQIPNFTGVTSPYEIPENPTVTVRTDEMSIEECVDAVMKSLQL